MILINEFKLSNGTIRMIGEDLGIKWNDKIETYYDYVGRIISIGEEEPQ